MSTVHPFLGSYRMGTLCMLNPAAGQIRARTEWITTVRPTRFSMPPVGRGCMVLRRRHRDMNRERDMGPSSSHHHHLQHHYGGASRDKMVSFSHSSSSLSSSSSSSHCLNLKRSIKSGEIIEYHGSIVVCMTICICLYTPKDECICVCV